MKNLYDAALELRHALSNVLQHTPKDMWPKWLEVRDRADIAIAEAKVLLEQPPTARTYMEGYSDGKAWALETFESVEHSHER